MQVASVFCIVILLNIVTLGCGTVLASAGYLASNPRVRDFLIKTGLGSLIRRKADRFYDGSNFRYVSDQGTNVRKAQMDIYDIVEEDPDGKIPNTVANIRRSGLHGHQNYTREGDRVYSERLFSVLTEMDRNSCVYRLLCEIGVDPKPYGIMGYKINHYIRSVPPVTWNSATFPYLEAFQAGFSGSKDNCGQHYDQCTYNLKQVMKFLLLFTSPINMKLTSAL